MSRTGGIPLHNLKLQGNEVEELLMKLGISYQWSPCQVLGISSAREAEAGVTLCVVQLLRKISKC